MTLFRHLARKRKEDHHSHRRRDRCQNLRHEIEMSAANDGLANFTCSETLACHMQSSKSRRAGCIDGSARSTKIEKVRDPVR